MSLGGTDGTMNPLIVDGELYVGTLNLRLDSKDPNLYKMASTI